MKIRKDFVTNSSSSSFICDICGRIESGWDMSLSEVGMVSCNAGHYMCEDEIDFYQVRRLYFIDTLKEEAAGGNEEAVKLLTRFDKAGTDSDEYNALFEDHECIWIDPSYLRYEIPVEYCPVCNHDVITDDEFIKYIIQTTGKNYDDLKKEAQAYYKAKS